MCSEKNKNITFIIDFKMAVLIDHSIVIIKCQLPLTLAFNKGRMWQDS